MANFSTKELLRIAEISSLQLNKAEVEHLREQLLKTINYTSQLDKFEAKEEHDAIKNINVFREDKAIQKDSSPLLAQAPETEQTYFVVPQILDQS